MTAETSNARGDVRIIARDIHYAIMDDGLAPLSNADNHKVREAILRVLEQALAAEGVQAEPKPEARGVVDVLAALNRAAESVKVPDKMTETRAEYFKAGARAMIAAMNRELAALTEARNVR